MESPHETKQDFIETSMFPGDFFPVIFPISRCFFHFFPHICPIKNHFFWLGFPSRRFWVPSPALWDRTRLHQVAWEMNPRPTLKHQVGNWKTYLSLAVCFLFQMLNYELILYIFGLHRFQYSNAVHSCWMDAFYTCYPPPDTWTKPQRRTRTSWMRRTRMMRTRERRPQRILGQDPEAVTGSPCCGCEI